MTGEIPMSPATIRAGLEFLFKCAGDGNTVGLPVAVTSDGQRVVIDMHADAYLVRLRCPVCHAIGRVLLPYDELVPARLAGGEAFYDYAIGKAKAVADMHRCDMELVP